MRTRPVTVAAIAGAVITIAIAFLPALSFAYARPQLHLVLETAESLIGLVVLYLVAGRVLQRRQLNDATLLFALMVLAGSNIRVALEGALSEGVRQSYASWGTLASRLVGALAVMAAAFVPPRPIVRPTAAVGRAVLAGALVVVAGLAMTLTLDELLPPLFSGQVPTEATRPHPDGHAAMFVIQLVSMIGFAAAAVGFERRGRRRGDEFLRWIAAAMTLSAFARVHYLLFPSLYTDYVYSGDVLRLASYIVLLYAGAREVRGYWRAQAQAAVAEERRKIARDLHDGLAQELNFVTLQSRRLLNRPDLGGAAVELQRIASAGERALDESRRAIDFLTHPVDEPLTALLERTVEQVAGRYGTAVRVHVEAVPALDPVTAEHLLRITREAVTNACRHGQARRIEVRLALDGDGVVLTVTDDGHGFDVAEPRRRGFGMTSMQERAAAIGGQLEVTSGAGAGATIMLRIPGDAPR